MSTYPAPYNIIGNTSLGMPPHSIPFVDTNTGIVSPIWWHNLNGLYGRVGGSYAPTNNQLNTVAIRPNPEFIDDFSQDEPMTIPGPIGPQGFQGLQGTQGAQGFDGEDGIDGMSVVGPKGSQGLQGIQGVNGFDGEDGQDGISVQGPQGITGATGAIGPATHMMIDDAPMDVFSEALTFTQSQVIPAARIKGSTDGATALPGFVGEYITATGTSISLTNSVNANITSILLTAGTWNVYGSILFVPASTTSTTLIAAGITPTSVTFPAPPFYFQHSVSNIGTPQGGVVPSQIIKLTTTTTYYLVALSNFTVSTMVATGIISALRIN